MRTGIPISEYKSKVKEDIVSKVDYGRWINFQESYPPISIDKYQGTMIEILHRGNPYFHSVFHNGETVRLRCYDWSMDLFVYNDPEYTNDYWRFVPPPPGNEGYDVG